MKLRSLAKRALVATPLPELLLRYRARKHVTVMGYHRITPPVGEDYPFNESVISATPEEFARELRYLRANLDVISIRELLQGLRNPALLPPRPAVITFDDGYLDNHQYALPLLREANLPACFFVCSGLIGTNMIPWQEVWVCCLKRSRRKRIESPFGDEPPYELDGLALRESIRRFRRRIWNTPWSDVPGYLDRLCELTCVDPQEHLTEPMFMSWQAVRDLHAAGMEIGGHTRTHPNLRRVDDPQTMREEIGGCYEDLARFVQPPVAFAYPFGYSEFMSDAADEAIRCAGFQISFSFIHGFASRQSLNTYRLPRIHASHGEDYQAFRLATAVAPTPVA